ncbi:MAG TPA: hypothetical protein VH000_07240 [Rhizomicrobium sp.]|nr:hypothetical protein [Rhizomicrobium sp.]
MRTAAVRHHRWRHNASRYTQSYSQSYSQQSAQADYDYVSPSRSYAPPPPRGVGWIDGYGRPHFASYAEIDHYVRRTSSMAAYTPQRLDPWHKYDERCDWR